MSEVDFGVHNETGLEVSRRVCEEVWARHGEASGMVSENNLTACAKSAELVLDS